MVVAIRITPWPLILQPRLFCDGERRLEEGKGGNHFLPLHALAFKNSYSRKMSHIRREILRVKHNLGAFNKQISWIICRAKASLEARSNESREDKAMQFSSQCDARARAHTRIHIHTHTYRSLRASCDTLIEYAAFLIRRSLSPGNALLSHPE